MRFSEPSIHQRLRRQTQESHTRLHGMLPLLNPHITVQQLRGVIRAFYGFYAPLEESICRAAGESLSLLGEVHRRQKTRWLMNDLRALGDTAETISQLPSCGQLPRVEAVSHVIGVLYVLEGATLGGQVIAQALRTNIGQHLGCQFFTSYGEYVAAMWDSFLALLAQQASSEEAERQIAASACATFERLEGWLHALSSTYR